MLVSDEFNFRLSFYKAFAVFCIKMMTLVATTGGKVPMSSICGRGE